MRRRASGDRLGRAAGRAEVELSGTQSGRDLVTLTEIPGTGYPRREIPCGFRSAPVPRRVPGRMPHRGTEPLPATRQASLMSAAPKPDDFFNTKQIRRLISLMEKHDLAEVDLKNADQRVRIKRGGEVVVICGGWHQPVLERVQAGDSPEDAEFPAAPPPEMEEPETEAPVKKKKKKEKREKEIKVVDEAEEERKRKKEEKKRKKLEEEERAVYAKYESMEVNPSKRPRTEEGGGEYFRRLGDESQWLAKATVKDNSHWTAKRGGDSWGAQAAEDLIKVRGKDFKKEMQKKKRATWMGAGLLDNGINSIVYSDSD